jgi:hypothetical protein
MTEIRVYSCDNCRNVGYERVTSREVDSYCSLCRETISDKEGMIYVSTEDEARRRASILAIRAQAARPKSNMGIGLRRRILEIVESLVNMNSNRPVTVENVLTECLDAGIAKERARHFLDVLAREELITRDGGYISLVP